MTVDQQAEGSKLTSTDEAKPKELSLVDLRWIWERLYHVGFNGKVFYAQYVGTTVILTADSTSELHALVKADLATRTASETI
jgi:hypothetical protein